jgi:IPT/TIG domain
MKKTFWAMLALLVVLVLTSTWWGGFFERRQLRIISITPNHGRSGDWVEVRGDNFSPKSKFWIGKVEVKEMRFVSSHDVFVRIP